jgi:rifampicin phosphotransferase
VNQDESFVALASLRQSDVNRAGGKAAALGEVSRAGCEVPPGFVVPTEFYRRWRSDALPTRFDFMVRERCASLRAGRFAVRSSSPAEDGAEASWAGQFETVLGVAAEDVPGAIRQCWASLITGQTAAYAASRTTSRPSEMAVIVQVMVAGDISGVLFTVDPVSKNPSRCAVEAVAGLAETLVQGIVTPQSYLLRAPDGDVIAERRHQQRTRAVLREDGIVYEPLALDFEIPITEDLLHRLYGTGRRLAAHFGSPQDVEWTFAGESLLVLQSRPITTL